MTNEEKLKKLRELKNPELVTQQALSAMLENFKIIKGDPGYTPVKGKDYFTEEEQKSFITSITPVKGVDYIDGEDGKTPVAGVDFPIPVNGKKGDKGDKGDPGITPTIDTKKIIKEVVSLIVVPKSDDIVTTVLKKIDDRPINENLVQKTELVEFLKRGGFRGGGGGSSVALKTNSVANGSQSILNLKNGTNITITDDGVGGITIASSASGATKFTQLTDVPNSYVGQGGKAVRVNAGETALEFFSASGSGTVTSVASADGSIAVTNATTTPDLAVVKAPKWTTARNLAGNSVDGSANVPFANKFIVQGTTDTGLTNAQFLGALTTGIVKNTTTTGVLSIAVAADFPTLNQNTTGSAATLTTGRTISITGDLAYTSPSFDGSGNVTATGTLATVNANVGTFTNATITVNAKGLITAASNGTAPVTSISITTQDGVSGSSSGGATPVLTILTGATTITVAQTAHGFSTGNVLKSSGTADQYALAKADSAANAEVVGIVSRVIDANNFVMTTEGVTTTGVPTNTAGTVYFLDPTTAGAVTATKPSTIGQVVKPVLTILNSATRALFSHSLLGILISAANTTPYSPTIGGTGVVNNAANTITFSGNFGLTLTLSNTTALTLPTAGTLATLAGTETFTNKRITKRVSALSAGSATPAINTDTTDVVHITAQSAAITSFTTNLTGTPVDGDTLRISITDNGTARAITWGASFEASTVALPTTTVINARLDVGFFWNTATSKWRCVAVA